MKNWVKVLGICLIALSFLLSGCVGGSTPDPEITALNARVTAAETAQAALEARMNALPNMSGVINDVTQLRADIVAIRAQLSTPSTYVTPAQLASAVANWEAQYNTLNTKVNSIDARVTVLEGRTIPTVTLETVRAQVAATQLALRVNLVAARSVAFEFKYIPSAVLNITAASYQLALDSLYTTPPASMNVGVALVPVYSLMKIDPATYQLVCVTFLTPGTALVVGENSKLITVGGSGTWEVRMLEIATTASGGSTW